MERSAHPDNLAITEHIVSALEAEAVAKVHAQANATAYRVIEGLLDILELLGHVTRKR